MDFAKRLDYQIGKSKETNKTLSMKITALGKPISKESLSKYRRGERTPNPEMIECICDILNISELDLFPKSEQKKEQIIKEALLYPSEKTKAYLTEAGYGADRIKEVELNDGYVGGGSSGEMGFVIKTFFIDKYIIAKRYRDSKVSAIQVIGDSMEPYAPCGSLVLFVPISHGETLGDGKYIIETSQGKMLKNLKIHVDGSITIFSENSKYESERISRNSQESFRVIGRAVGRVLKS